MGWATEHNPHSMISDWPLQDPSMWNIHQKAVHCLDLFPVVPGRPLPVFPKTAMMPCMSSPSHHVFIIFFAAIPMVLHQLWVASTSHTFGGVAAFLLYGSCYVFTAMHEIRLLRRLSYKYGCLDGDVHDRDGLPNTGVGKVVGEMFKGFGLRMAMAIVLSYNPEVTPLFAFGCLQAWPRFLLKLSTFGVVLDFFFYSYHRACHEIPFLWKYHRTHHLAKHPITVLAGFSDDEQELVESTIVPLLTYFTLSIVGLELNFYEWWVCFSYLTYSELFGHSGLRAHFIVPSPISGILGLLGMELSVEDHDLHHRKGWKKSFNYGKQTRVWDRLFGTCTDRLEAKASNLDERTMVKMPLF